MRSGLILALMLLLSLPALARELSPFEDARRLEEEGLSLPAFRAYLAIDHAEHLAARIARSDPKQYLAVLSVAGAEVPQWRVDLLSGDLQLSLGEKSSALEHYRAAAAGLVDLASYPAEPGQYPTSLAAPFTRGPGSHRDNWLIRRFLALDALPDAGREFARIWRLHQPSEQPFFSRMGLRFALDYAFFLLQTDHEEEALEVLLAPLLVLNMDRARGAYSGVDRQDFVRLAFGVFTSVDRGAKMVEIVEDQVNAGNVRALRVLAELKRQEGRPEEALVLELAYVDEAEIPEPGRSFRRGTAYDEMNRTAEAARAFEMALDAPWSRPNLPDPPGGPSFPSQRDPLFLATDDGEGGFRDRVLRRLERLYTSLGRTEDMLRTALARLTNGPEQIGRLDPLLGLVARCETAGHREIFTTWARETRGEMLSSLSKANLAFASGDLDQAIRDVVDGLTERQDTSAVLKQWRERFQNEGETVYREFLTRITAAAPTDARSRLELLALDGNLDGEEAIAVMEEILTGRAKYDYQRFRGKGNRVDFGSPFALAGRLTRLYEIHDRRDDLVTLGLRIARGDAPFATPEIGGYDWETREEDRANACLARAIHLASEAQLIDLEAALRDSPYRGAFAQLARRGKGPWSPAAPVEPFGWSNLPEDVRLLAGSECVLTLARDDEYVYAGHPFGIAVYDHAGNPVTRIALADSALAIAVQGNTIWSGGTEGLYRIERGDWTVSRMKLDGHPGKRERGDYETRVSGLALHGDELWIAIANTVKVLDTKNLTVRAFSREEVRAGKRFLFLPGEVFVEGDTRGIYRYDRTEDLWTKVPGEARELRLIGLIDGKLFVSVNLGDPLRHRPGLLDRETLSVTPLQIEAPPADGPVMINEPFHFFGRLGGRPVFGWNRARFVFDEQATMLRRIPGSGDQPPKIESEIPRDLPASRPIFHADGRISSEEMNLLTLPDGTVVIGRKTSRAPRYISLQEDWPFDTMPHGARTGSGGLEFRFPDGRAERVSSIPHADTLPGDEVFRLETDRAGRIWLGTRGGLAVLDPEGRVIARFTTADGLLGNRMNAAAVVAGRLFFGSGWGDSAGAVTEFHPETGVFTFRLVQDGLPTAKVQDLEAKDGILHVTPAPEYQRGGPRCGYECQAPFDLDPATGAVTRSGPPVRMDDNEADKLAKPERKGPLPFLGGEIIGMRVIGNRRILHGTRGVVIVPAVAGIEDTMPKIEVEIERGPRAGLIADALKRNPRIENRKDLERCLADDNPYFRAAALLKAAYRENPEFVDPAAACLDDPLMRVRASAIYLLSRIEDPSVIPPLEVALSDPDPILGAHAVLALCRNGAPPDVTFLRSILEHHRWESALPAGASGDPGVRAEKDELYAAVAPHATPEIFALLIEFPLGTDDYEPRARARAALGRALVKHPEGLAPLLGARSPEQVRFARAVIGEAGPALLPHLSRALESRDRDVVANAALGCGAIGDPAAIDRLVAILDFESGLVRAAAVTALGNLKAVSALPRLAQLYTLARVDPQDGWRARNATSAFTRDTARLARLADIAGEWNELKAATLQRSIPREFREDRLDAKDILKAIAKIGPENAQEFYRRIAADDRPEGRAAAAIGLAAGGHDQLPANRPVLLSLLADQDPGVAAGAAVSLLLLDQEAGRAATLAWLEDEGSREQGRILYALKRVRVREQIEFALPRIEKIAEDPDAGSWERDAAREILRNVTTTK
jgi:HEAT repeat protein